ncbi:MAG: DUF4932 domain-containing protein [Bacillota bacterium]
MLILLLLGTAGAAPATADPVVREQAPGIYVAVLPEMELMTAVLRQTEWMEDFIGREGGGEYSRAMDRFFSAHSQHRAAEIAGRLLARGFAHDAPANLAFRLGSPPELSLVHPYDEYLIRRAGSEAELDRFRRALSDFAGESDFADFFEQHRSQLETAVEEVASDLDGPRLVQWLETFYGWRAAEYHTVLAPAMSPAGGYGATVRTASGEVIMVGVIRTGDGPIAGESLAGLTLHEWSHSYVDPTLAGLAVEVYELRSLFEPVEERMRDQLYANVHTFVNEQVIRAICALAMKDLYGGSAYEREIAVNEGRGFYLTRHLADYLEDNYRSRRDAFDTFADFAPEIVAEMTSLDPADFSTGMHLRATLRSVPFVLMAAVVLAASAWWLVYGLRRRRALIQEMDDGELPPRQDDPE